MTSSEREYIEQLEARLAKLEGRMRKTCPSCNGAKGFWEEDCGKRGCTGHFNGCSTCWSKGYIEDGGGK